MREGEGEDEGCGGEKGIRLLYRPCFDGTASVYLQRISSTPGSVSMMSLTGSTFCPGASGGSRLGSDVLEVMTDSWKLEDALDRYEGFSMDNYLKKKRMKSGRR